MKVKKAPSEWRGSWYDPHPLGELVWTWVVRGCTVAFGTDTQVGGCTRYCQTVGLGWRFSAFCEIQLLGLAAVNTGRGL